MHLSRLVLVATAIVLLTAACKNTKPGTTAQTQPSSAAPVSATATPDEFASARANFAKHCKECHGDRAEGQTVTKDGKKLKVPSLRMGHALHHPDAEFVKQITKGGDGMPAFGEGTPAPSKEKLSAKEIEDMVRFIRHEFQGGNASPMMSPMKMK
jgi:mono/diheme cytochrome c family protein